MENYKVIIVGSGAAGLNCALQLYRKGIDPKDIVIITEKLGAGTSFNAGSDKQTYYKLCTVGSDKDSPYKMAENLYNGGAMHGDIALIESTCSIQAFMNLVNIGVPFPHDEYGAYVGYKTDNDDLQRGTSTGPLTSKYMSDKLLDEVQKAGIVIKDQRYVIELIKNEEMMAENPIVSGVICLKINELKSEIPINENDIEKFIETFQGQYIVLATGGPASIYKNSVYPESQWGSTSLAIKAGAVLQNLTESQYGLASKKFRWNVSGTYQQVIPRYISLPYDEDPLKTNQKPIEFLNNYFPNFIDLTKATFLKGYQWPFNPERIVDYGSSLIDMAVHIETIEKKNKVYLDFMNNPSGFEFNLLHSDVKHYLNNSGATQSLPIERLKHMNPKSIELYKNHGIDITCEPLEIALCAQHNNGGVKGDIWWETSIQNLFVIGEINGSHGVHRPGGSALNSGQVGGIRVSDKICYRQNQNQKDVNYNDFNKTNSKYHSKIIQTKKKIQRLLNNPNKKGNLEFLYIILNKIQTRMMISGAYIRNSKKIENSLMECYKDINSIEKISGFSKGSELILYYKILDALYTQFTYLTAIQDYINKNGGSRGSFIISNDDNVNTIFTHDLLKKYPMKTRNHELDDIIQEISLISLNFENYNSKCNNFEIKWVKRREIPNEKKWFENVWRDFNKKKVFK